MEWFSHRAPIPCNCVTFALFTLLQFSFGLGVYAGIYLSQNYDVPKVDEPAKVLDKVKEYLDDHKKK